MRAQVSDSTPGEKLSALALRDDVQRGKYRGLLTALTRDSPRWISCEGLWSDEMRHETAGQRHDAPVARLQRAVSIELD